MDARSRIVASRGFTMVELLTAIAVIAVLLGILVPVLGQVRAAGHEAREMSAARQLMLAWTSYAVDSRDAVLPGKRSGLTARDNFGVRMAGEAAARYPWRIAPYLDYNLRGLYINEHVRVLAELEQGEEADLGIERSYLMSLSPSLGINGTFIGGNEHPEEHGFDPGFLAAFGTFYVTHAAQIRRASDLLVFASARGQDPLVSGEGPAEGYFMVTPPRLTAIDGERWTATFDASNPPADYGYLSPRYADAAVVGFADGHAARLTTNELRDMRHWANQARREDFALVPR
ncbi:MAG: type II secretion system protein [Phycisphaerales bacterium]|nr:type II secretion system GspH family protein [Phycisphaerae bacterium]NNF42437.1 type II secretion system protein [Phycisphaerales bacterium]NNM26922.1 type II secretion system protein [Phycisphaerales bacterium]